VNLKKRLQERRKFEEEEGREKREKRNEKRKAAKMRREEGVRGSVMTGASGGAENMDADAVTMARLLVALGQRKRVDTAPASEIASAFHSLWRFEFLALGGVSLLARLHFWLRKYTQSVTLVSSCK